MTRYQRTMPAAANDLSDHDAHAALVSMASKQTLSDAAAHILARRRRDHILAASQWVPPDQREMACTAGDEPESRWPLTSLWIAGAIVAVIAAWVCWIV